MNWFNVSSLAQILIFLFLSISNDYHVGTAPVRYDQSQTGDLNVQIHLKNVELYAILNDGFLNSEYDYDYADLTEKPSTSSSHEPETPVLNATTTKPVTNLTNIPENSTLLVNNSLNFTTPAYHDQSSSPTALTNSAVIHVTVPLKVRKCAPGYYRDNFGRCRRLRKTQSSFLEMIHSPGVIKSFQQPVEQVGSIQSGITKP